MELGLSLTMNFIIKWIARTYYPPTQWFLLGDTNAGAREKYEADLHALVRTVGVTTSASLLAQAGNLALALAAGAEQVQLKQTVAQLEQKPQGFKSQELATCPQHVLEQSARDIEKVLKEPAITPLSVATFLPDGLAKSQLQLGPAPPVPLQYCASCGNKRQPGAKKCHVCNFSF